MGLVSACFLSGAVAADRNFSQHPGFAEYFAANPPAGIATASDRALTRRHAPRFHLPAGHEGPIDFYVETVFRAMWVDEKKMDDPAVIGEVLTAAGFDAEAIFARTREPEVKQKLIELTGSAVDRGVFGSPAFFAGDRQFFGKDRMNLFEAALVRGK